MHPCRLLPLALGALMAIAALAATPTTAPTPPATTFTGLLSLVRYDLPVGRSDGFAPTRQLARRRDGQDAVDWPDLHFNRQPIFRSATEERIVLPLRPGTLGNSPFQEKTDDRIEPGNHWFRALAGRDGKQTIYTADPCARSGSPNETMAGKYELWTFPVQITAEGAPVKIVLLKVGGQTVFQKDGPWRSLTLLLPSSEPGKPYELSVDSHPAVNFQVGLQAIKPGAPREKLRPVNLILEGEGPKIRVQSLARPEEFPQAQEWTADVEALPRYAPFPIRTDRPPGLRRFLGIEVPRSPITIYATQLPQGLSGGFAQPGAGGLTGSTEEYGAMLAEQGFDALFPQANTLLAPEQGQSFEQQAAAFAKNGLKLGLQYDNSTNRPSFQHPQVALYSHTLPEWHAPLYRSLSLAAQRLGRLPNFLGFNLGAGSDGYAGNPPGERPSPLRPWGEAMVGLLGLPQPTVPRPGGAGSAEQPYEYTAPSAAEFLKYVQRYDASFGQYGYFAEAVRLANPRLLLTTAAFGSSPGTQARGGWPGGSLPGRLISESLPVQQAYDLNRTQAALPLHNLALTDRLSSYWPRKATWSLLDNHQFHYSREAYQRACALALTRGVQGIGTNFLALPGGGSAQPEVAAFQAEMHALIHRYGGAFVHNEPQAVIGIFYGQQEALLRGVLKGDTPSGQQIYDGSHEGKVTEALFLCHAAGWPARVITYQEIQRGPLPPSMRALLLVGMKSDDQSRRAGVGLESALQQFVAQGGRILADQDSTWAAPYTPTRLHVAAYQPQSNVDCTPLLLARNRENIDLLRTAMVGVPAPVAASAEPRLWMIPTLSGDVQYVTAINQNFAEGDEAAEFVLPPNPKATRPEVWKTKANASRFVKPQTGTVQWQTDRPIYDLRAARQLTREEAASVDLTHDAFRWYALPPAEPTAPAIRVSRRPDGFYEAMVSVSPTTPLRGVPVQLTISHGADRVDLFGASGFAIPLPLSDREPALTCHLHATELLSGLTGGAEITTEQRAEATVKTVALTDAGALGKFAQRKETPLVVALTPEQAKDAALVGKAQEIVQYYQGRGRSVTLGSAAPSGVVESLQPLRSPHRYPQWKTAPVDLVLFGLPSNNVLMLDQLRGEIWPLNFRTPKPGTAALIYSRSPFVGEMDVVNLVAPDLAGLAEAVRTLTQH